MMELKYIWLTGTTHHHTGHSVLLFHLCQRVKVQTRVEYNPRHKKAGKRCHEALLHQLPGTAVLLLVDALVVDGVQVGNATANSRKSKE